MRANAAWVIVRLIGRALWISAMVLTPLFAFWLASSLAAFHNASQWLSLAVGLLLFPILPLGWDLFFVWRRGRREQVAKPILTRLDRLVLRTLIVSGLFLGVTLYWRSDTAFRALAVRGDWMLDGEYGELATRVRGWLLGFADRLDERRVIDDDRYGTSDTAPEVVATETRDPAAWPLPAAIDPLVAEMPENIQGSIAEVGQYLAARFADPKQRIKAIHDYVALRLSYDFEALRNRKDPSKRPSQVADDVFGARKAVCEGYARLMVALGKAAGMEVAYITGFVRDREQRLDGDAGDRDRSILEGYMHAWNAVKLDGQWHLVDTTWDDASDEVRTTYLLTPPKLMTFDHFPEDTAWQLLASPLALGDFVRQPLLSPAIGQLGLSLVAPTRSQITVDGEASIVLENPQGAIVAAEARVAGSEKSARGIECSVSGGARIGITCALPDGEYEVVMFAAPASRAKAGRYSLDYIGSVLVNSH